MLRLRDLNAANARLCLKVEKVCRALDIIAGQKLILAVSGGSDSMALALIMSFIAPRLEVDLIALHIDHELRSASAEEAAYVRNFCASIGLFCVIRKENIRALADRLRCGVEEAGHHGRAAIFEEMRGSFNADFVLTAHQLDDLAEDIILRLIRGSGWPALGGMSWKQGYLRRPLLHTSRADLKTFVTSCGFRWINDSSNEDLSFRRNRVRHLLMPLLACENPSLTQTLSHLHDLGELDADYWAELLDHALKSYPWEMDETSITLSKELLQSLHSAARLRLFLLCIEVLVATHKGQARFDTLMKLEKAWQEGRGGKLFQFGGISALIIHGTVCFRRVA